MDNYINIVKKPVIIAIVINIALPMLLKGFATKEEIKPPNGADKLNFKGQFMHMMVHHNQVILSSSFSIGLIVGLSVYLSRYLNF